VVRSDARPRGHLFRDLGLSIETVGDEMRGTADIVPNLCVPGTESLRISVVATWTDIVLGYLVARALSRVPVTLELDVHLYAEIRGPETVSSVARVVKAGQSQVVCAIDFMGEAGNPLGFGQGVLMPTSDARLPKASGRFAARRSSEPPSTLLEPLASRVGCERTGRGVASLPCDPYVLNPAKALHGGITALVVEEAVVSADATDHTLASMTLRYLRPIRTGPAVATAELRAGLGAVAVHDAATEALAVLATTRSFGSY
jgi:acyl-coenzyme A thioesterase PaaI-like protein